MLAAVERCILAANGKKKLHIILQASATAPSHLHNTMFRHAWKHMMRPAYSAAKTPVCAETDSVKRAEFLTERD